MDTNLSAMFSFIGEHMIKRGVLFSGIFLYSFIVLTVPDSILKFKRYMCNGAIFGKLKQEIYSSLCCYLKEVSYKTTYFLQGN